MGHWIVFVYLFFRIVLILPCLVSTQHFWLIFFSYLVCLIPTQTPITITLFDWISKNERRKSNQIFLFVWTPIFLFKCRYHKKNRTFFKITYRMKQTKIKNKLNWNKLVHTIIESQEFIVIIFVLLEAKQLLRGQSKKAELSRVKRRLLSTVWLINIFFVRFIHLLCPSPLCI